MLPTGIESGLLKAAGRAAAYLGRRALTYRQQQQLADQVRGLMSGESVVDVLENLEQSEIQAVLHLMGSAEFDDVVLRVVVWSVTGTKEAGAAELREALRSGLARRGVDPENLLPVTDVIFDLIKREAAAARNSLGTGFMKETFAVSVAADLAAAGARKSKLLERVRSVETFTEVAASFRRQVVALRNGMSLTHLGGRVRVPFDRLYVSPEFTDDPNSGDADRTVTIEEILVDRRRCVVLGDPGAGKSTLAAKLVRDLAADHGTSVEGQVPILLVTRDHGERIGEGGYVMAELLRTAMREPYNVKVDEDCLEYLLLAGEVTVVIDGIDEIAELHQRRRFAASVEGFAHLYPHVRIVVTSRSVGYSDAALDSELFPCVFVRPFRDGQVAAYARVWFGLDDGMSADRRAGIVQAFLIESESVADLRSNPLMLSLLCSLYSAEFAIPRHRAGVYEKCAELLFQEWDKHRGLTVPEPYASHLRPAVAALAWHIFSDPKGRQALPRSEVHAFLTNYLLERRFTDEAEAMGASEALLEFCAGRAWVLTEVGSGSLEPWYGFTHRTFLEYFAAVQLVRRDPTPEAVWGRLKSRPLDSSWTVVAQLALQIVDKQNEDGADRTLSLVMDEARTGDSGTNPWLAFAAMSLRAVIPTSATVRRVTEAGVDNVLEGVRRVRRTYYNPTHDLLRSDRDHFDEVLKVILEGSLPENSVRARKIIQRRLDEIAGEPVDAGAGGHEPARILWEVLTYPFGEGSVRQDFRAFMPFAGLAETAAPPWPPIFAPDSRSITRYGVATLFNATNLLLQEFPSYASELLDAALNPSAPEARRVAAAGELEDLYDALTSAPWPWLRRRKADEAAWVPANDWARLRPVIDPKVFAGKLSRRARGSAVLLMLPMWQGDDLQAVGSGVFDFVAGARYSPATRRNAQAMVGEWWLPSEAEAIVGSWVERLDSPVVGYR